MKKYAKLFTILLSTSCLTEVAHTATSSAIEMYKEESSATVFPVTIPGAKPPGKAVIPPETLGSNYVGKIRNPEGRGYDFSRLMTSGIKGLEIAVATPDLGNNSKAYNKSMAIPLAADALEFGSIGFQDIRSVHEQGCDTNVLWAYKDLIHLRDGLNDFATGKIEDDLSMLSRAIKKLDAPDSFIVDVVKLFPPLIKKLRGKAIGLRDSLSTDIPIILGALNQTVEHHETYIRERIPVAHELGGPKVLTLTDLVLPNDSTQDRKVSLEGVDITDIHAIFFQVEQTLNNIMGHKLKSKFLMIGDFLSMVENLKTLPPSDHSQQIIALSQMFIGDIAIANFIDSRWISPEAPDFQSFKDGVKYINMLIELIRSYAVSAKEIAYGTHAKAILDELKTTTSTALVEGREASAIVSKSPGMGTPEQQLKELVSKKRGAESSMERTQLPDLQNLKGRIEVYLAT